MLRLRAVYFYKLYTQGSRHPRYPERPRHEGGLPQAARGRQAPRTINDPPRHAAPGEASKSCNALFGPENGDDGPFADLEAAGGTSGGLMAFVRKLDTRKVNVSKAIRPGGRPVA